MFLIIYVPIHIIFGFLAYGLYKGDFKRSCEFDESRKYIRTDELFCRFMGVIGIMGFVAVLWGMDEWRFCLKMPEKLKE